jgi:hypothetical protein
VVTLVTDGIVRDLLMSRIPRKDLGGSNGHARGSPGQRLGGRAAMTVITPDRARSRQQLRKQALQMARSYGLDHVIVVRRIEDDQMRFIGDFPAMTFSYGGDDDAAAFRLPRPLIVERLYDDGHTEPVRGLAFAGVHRWVLRDIVAAGPEAELTYLAPFQAGQAEFEPNAGMPSHLSAPEVLIGEMELVPVSGDPRDVPVVPAP